MPANSSNYFFNLSNLSKMSDIRTQAPKNITVIISLILVVLGLFGANLNPSIAANDTLFMLAGYALLLLGVFIKGL
jgi:hypothetical protein